MEQAKSFPVVIQGKTFDVIGVQDLVIEDLNKKALSLTIKDVDDKPGYEAVHTHRMLMKKTRVMVQNHGKELREDAVRYQKDIIKEETRLVTLMKVGEDHLNAEEKKIDDAIAEIKARATKELEDRTQARARILVNNYGMKWDGKNYFINELFTSDLTNEDISVPYEIMKHATDEQFNDFCSKTEGFIIKDQKVKEAKAHEAAALAKIEAARIAEEKEALAKAKEEQEQEKRRLAAVEAEYKKKAQEQAEKEAALQAEKDAIDRAKQKAINDAAEAQRLEDGKKEAVAIALRIADEKKAAEDRKKKAAEEKARKKAERAPDEEKIRLWEEAILSVPDPTLKAGSMIELFKDTKLAIHTVLQELDMRLKED